MVKNGSKCVFRQISTITIHKNWFSSRIIGRMKILIFRAWEINAHESLVSQEISSIFEHFPSIDGPKIEFFVFWVFWILRNDIRHDSECLETLMRWKNAQKLQNKCHYLSIMGPCSKNWNLNTAYNSNKKLVFRYCDGRYLSKNTFRTIFDHLELTWVHIQLIFHVLHLHGRRMGVAWESHGIVNPKIEPLLIHAIDLSEYTAITKLKL